MQNDSSTRPMPTVLESIVSGRRSHLPEIQARISHVDPARLPRSTRSLFHALGGHSDGGPALRGSTRFIMECKSSSPSLGMIREDYHPGDIARVYSRYAAGISVLCEPDRFGGDYNHLATVAATTHLPVLCKDFIIHPAQVHAARYFGADAILLMLSVLDDATYTELSQEAARLGLDVLTEVIDEVEVERAIRLGATIFGINHRNLHDLSIDLNRSARLAQLIPDSAVIVSESGIRNNETVRQLSGHSSAFLVGSQLTSQPDVDRAARELVYGLNKVCGLQSPSEAQAARASGAIYGGLIFVESSPRNVSRETSKKSWLPNLTSPMSPSHDAPPDGPKL
ncbi:bifunctional indole-3-glycerol-phosphate synthase TrpC/phosphoribosylanthranilate isomerase TrpF [Corynebacterium diphtheriae]|nr:bifunctional indole-3-glycerol-phosphate synthase TrpC/phosphoribosylanthranilate isomerase TrpF [Corynebacterium diphtheriae]CAB0974340.1 bifunctional indole-3-glycerol-phosphate synthase TrpC/phosphoribosylanthranilate isomerase TrpF [Corynebacterium diphtheriae]